MKSNLFLSKRKFALRFTFEYACEKDLELSDSLKILSISNILTFKSLPKLKYEQIIIELLTNLFNQFLLLSSLYSLVFDLYDILQSNLFPEINGLSKICLFPSKSLIWLIELFKEESNIIEEFLIIKRFFGKIRRS